jgi:hypothetical protein
MKTTHTPPPLPGAHDALFDLVECRLRALTTAPLHGPVPTSDPRHYVDEFADGFPGFVALTPIPLARRWRTAP